MPVRIYLIIFLLLSLPAVEDVLPGSEDKEMDKISGKQSIILASYADSDESLRNLLIMAESIREFGGRFSSSPIMIYMSDEFNNPDKSIIDRLTGLGTQFRTSSIPDDANWLYYSGKTFAAGQAESDIENAVDILIWMDEDTVVLREPSELDLCADIAFAYRPVMHNRSGSLYSEPPNPFWDRIYRLLDIDGSLLFPMVTPADRQTIRAYFNAGLLAVRPEEGILRNWGRSFEVLYRDAVLAGMCRDDVEKRIFLHQTALVGTVKLIDKSRMKQLPLTYNYPLFFQRQYDAVGEFDSIYDIVTLRYDVYFRNPDPEWKEKLKGPSEKVGWLRQKLGKSGGS